MRRRLKWKVPGTQLRYFPEIPRFSLNGSAMVLPTEEDRPFCIITTLSSGNGFGTTNGAIPFGFPAQCRAYPSKDTASGLIIGITPVTRRSPHHPQIGEAYGARTTR